MVMTFAEKVLNAETGRTHIFSVGQAGYIVKSKQGALLGIDLYLSDCVERVEGHMGFKRLLPNILSPKDLVFDCIVATHAHYDHFDVDAIPELMSNTKTVLYASANCEKEVLCLQMNRERISYIKPGESVICGDFAIDFVTCDHGTEAPDAVGVVIIVDGKKIYEAGDTCLRLERAKEYMEKGPFDILIAPINGAYGNLDERECAKLSGILNPKVTIPCHYGMFASHGGDPGLFYEIMKKEYPYNDVLLMTQGEDLIF